MGAVPAVEPDLVAATPDCPEERADARLREQIRLVVEGLPVDGVCEEVERAPQSVLLARLHEEVERVGRIADVGHAATRANCRPSSRDHEPGVVATETVADHEPNERLNRLVHRRHPVDVVGERDRERRPTAFEAGPERDQLIPEPVDVLIDDRPFDQSRADGQGLLGREATERIDGPDGAFLVARQHVEDAPEDVELDTGVARAADENRNGAATEGRKRKRRKRRRAEPVLLGAAQEHVGDHQLALHPLTADPPVVPVPERDPVGHAEHVSEHDGQDVAPFRLSRAWRVDDEHELRSRVSRLRRCQTGTHGCSSSGSSITSTSSTCRTRWRSAASTS